MRARRLDELTAREQEVLQLIRAGLTNEEIAERLGSSPDGAKYHVSQILWKLGVSSREEAAALSSPQKHRAPWWAGAPLWARIAGAGVMAAAVAGIGVLVWGVVAPTGSGEEERASTSAVPTRTPVPWIDSTPGPTPSPAPFPTPNPNDLAVRPCRAEDITGAVTGGNGAGGWIFKYFAFSNVSSEPCRLEGVPAMQFLDANGQAQPTTWREDPCIIPSVVVPCPHLVAVLQADTGQTALPDYRLKASQAALTLLYWGRLDDLPSYTPCPLSASAIAFDLPGDAGRVTVPLGGPMNACVAPGVSQFGPAPTPTPAPGARPELTARLKLPQTVVAGETLKFVADLTNTSPTVPFVFGDLCPEYTVILGAKQAQERHALSCRPVVSISAGGSASFSMELAIPANIAPGSYFSSGRFGAGPTSYRRV